MLFLQGFISGNLVFGLFSFSFLKFYIALRSSILSLDNHLVMFYTTIVVSFSLIRYILNLRELHHVCIVQKMTKSTLYHWWK